MFGVGESFHEELLAAYAPDYKLSTASTFGEMKHAVLDDSKPAQRVGIITPGQYQVLEFTKPHTNLSVGTLQEFLDKYVKSNDKVEIDYVHGDDVLDKLSKQEGNMGFYLPPITKDNFFKSVILDGALPRKTFSMGHAHDKRFYLEARRIL